MNFSVDNTTKFCQITNYRPLSCERFSVFDSWHTLEFFLQLYKVSHVHSQRAMISELVFTTYFVYLTAIIKVSLNGCNSLLLE